MGFEFKSNAKMAHVRALVNGLLLLSAFFLIRFFGGSALNLRGLPMGEGEEHRLQAFWALCKYPPSLGKRVQCSFSFF